LVGEELCVEELREIAGSGVGVVTGTEGDWFGAEVAGDDHEFIGIVVVTVDDAFHAVVEEGVSDADAAEAIRAGFRIVPDGPESIRARESRWEGGREGAEFDTDRVVPANVVVRRNIVGVVSVCSRHRVATAGPQFDDLDGLVSVSGQFGMQSL